MDSIIFVDLLTDKCSERQEERSVVENSRRLLTSDGKDAIPQSINYAQVLFLVRLLFTGLCPIFFFILFRSSDTHVFLG